MTFYDRLLALDRRWVFLVLGIFVIVPLIPAIKDEVKIPLAPPDEVRSIYSTVDSLKAGDYILIAMDYDPNAMAELHPMAYAMLEQCFAKKLKVVVMTLSQNGAGMVDGAIKDVVDSTKLYHNIEPKRGIDYVYLGYRPYPGLVILGMGQNFRIPYPADYSGTILDSLPMMHGIQNFNQMKCIINLSAGNVSDFWVNNAVTRYGAKLALGMTGVMAADFYPYYQSGQIFGIMGGMKGAAEYEYLAGNPGPALEAMKVQVFAHIVIIVFIILGNVGYFLDKRAKQARRESN